ncbi:hypothetical protein OAT67_01100 [Bacteriovoracaceae bacterium]|nr:hypothetical protein [Bacteriovoracaceae bacterium]
MKHFFLISFVLSNFLTSIHAHDLDIYGGSVVDKKGRRLVATCLNLNDDKCTEFSFYYYDRPERAGEKTLTIDIDDLDLSKIANFTAGRMNRASNDKYADAHYYLRTKAYNRIKERKPFGVTSYIGASAIDLAKSPVVWTTRILQALLIDTRNPARAKKAMRFIMNPNKRGKTKKMSKRLLPLLRNGMRDFKNKR